MKHLRLWRSIGELAPLPRVADRMAASQPAVTQALAELESLFGAPLFLRSARGMEPTELGALVLARARGIDRKSTRLNSSHLVISYAVFCLKKKNNSTWHNADWTTTAVQSRHT